MKNLFEKTWIAKEHFLPVRRHVNYLATEFSLKHKRKVETERAVQQQKIANQGKENVQVSDFSINFMTACKTYFDKFELIWIVK